MAPFHKPSWLAVLLVFTLALVAKAAVVETVAVRAESTDASVEVPNLAPADSNDADVSTTGSKGCKKLRTRKDWRKMKNKEKLAYVKAVQCLQRLKPNFGIPHARTRFDEFVGLHVLLMTKVHLVGQFLPWHRLLISEYEKTMNNECGYDGAQPYWDWRFDNKNFPNAAVFDPVYGFGSLPSQRSPIKDGPFAKYNLVFGIGGPEFNLTDHTLERGYNATQLKFITDAEVQRISSLANFEDFRVQLEGWPITPEPRLHDAGHYAVGGDLGDIWIASNDPLFYLHHTYLDRLWWSWQNAAPGRLYTITGRSTREPPYTNVTLDTLLPLLGLKEPTPIREVMDIRKSPLCYTYE